MYVGGIFCDLAKAFDRVNHKILLAKLCLYGIQGVAEVWRRSYWTTGRQKVWVTSPNTAQNFFSLNGVHWNTEFPKVNSRAFTVNNIYKLPIPENKFCIRTNIICQWCVTISSRNFEYFRSMSDLFLSHMIKWLAANNLVLSLDKTNIMKFITKNSAHPT